MRSLIKVSFVTIAALLVGALGLMAQEQPTPKEQAEMMAKYQELAQPGPEHKELAELAGKWKYSLKMWMSPNEPNAMQIEGTGENKPVIGGRFLQSTSSGSMMGQPFEGLSFLGFDRRSNEFTTVGFDNTGTYYVTAKGPRNEKTGEIVMTGKDYDPVGGFTQEYKFIMNIKDKDSYSFSVVFTDSVMSQGTGEFKMVEIEYNRVKE